MLIISSIPTKVIRQRPDVYRAQRELVIAAANLGIDRAALLPSLTFNGSIARTRSEVNGLTSRLNTWSTGPISITLPLFNRVGLYVQVKATEVAYESAGKNYASVVRHAVREIEQALVQIDNVDHRLSLAKQIVDAYHQNLESVQKKHQVGLVDTLLLEETRRSYLQSQNAYLSILLEKINAWIYLYQVAGGGFEPQQIPNEEELSIVSIEKPPH